LEECAAALYATTLPQQVNEFSNAYPFNPPEYPTKNRQERSSGPHEEERKEEERKYYYEEERKCYL
jgi:hypothetical protein